LITDAFIKGFCDALSAFLAMFPAIPTAPNFDNNVIVNTIETCGYLLPIQSMLATFSLMLAIKNWELFVSAVSWVWERIPFN
jgi:hypothetical protein